MQTKQSVTNSNIRSTVIAAFGMLSMVLALSQSVEAQVTQPTPLVFQAAGPDASSIQGAVDAFRASLGDNNGNNPGPIQKGRREINWDGGNPNLMDTTAPVNPFLVFLNTRGSQYKTPGLGLSQAPPSGGLQGGLAVLFANPGARDAAVEKGIIINGLPIMVKEPSYLTTDIENLDLYYEDCVIGGPGAFIMTIKDREKFQEAIRTKLVLEVAGLAPEGRIVPTAENEPRVSCLVGEEKWRERGRRIMR